MSERPLRRAWVGDLKVALIVVVAVLASSWAADGSMTLIVMFAVVIVVSLLLRMGGIGWRSTRRDRRRTDQA